MLPIRWDPLRDLGSPLGTLHREMDELFRRTFGTALEPATEGELLMAPQVNCFTKDQTFYVEAEIPGVEKKNLDINVEGRVLTLRGERKVSKETKKEDYLLRELQSGSFQRRLTLPDGVDTEKIRATYKNGVLEISMPMAKTLGGRKVLIEGAEEGTKKIH